MCKTEKPLLSVCVRTFNHEKYISQTLDSILSQETTFDFEIIISDDFSTDSTREIIVSYQKLFPQKINIDFPPKNRGVNVSFLEILKLSKGKYVTLCDGDDYYINNNKLQKQVEFLENNEQYIMCFHGAYELNDDTGQITEFYKLENRDYSGDEILSNWIIPTSAPVFNLKRINSNIFDKIMSDKENYHMDLTLFLILCEYGLVHCFEEKYIVYRRHSNSITYEKPSKNTMWRIIKHYRFIERLFDNKYKRIASKEKTIRTYYFGHTSLLDKNFLQAFCFYSTSFYYSPIWFARTIFKDIKTRILR